MKILSMTATFGKLDNARLELGDGLNLIYAPNEGGKSTWCAFWRAMLYGIDTRDRDKKGYLADKNRYQPWSGAPMSGEVVLEWQGRQIVIRRGPRGSVPFGAFSAVYAGTQEPVPELTAATCGQLLTGAGPQVFARSAFIGGDLALTTAPELESRIAAILSSGEEDVSYSQVQARLKDWLNKRRVNRSVGQIPRLEQELAQVAGALDDLEEAVAQTARLEGRRQELEERLHLLEEQLAAHRALDRQELAERRAQAQLELSSAQAQLAALEGDLSRLGAVPDRERLKNAQGQLQYLKVLDEEIQAGEEALRQADEAYVQAQIRAQDDRFTGQNAQEAAQSVQKALAEYRSCQETARTKGMSAKLFPVLGLILALGAGAVGLWQEGALLTGPLYTGLAALALSLLVGFIHLTSQRAWLGRCAKVLERFQVATPQELEQLLASYQAGVQAADLAAQHARELRGALNERKARRANSWDQVLALVHTFAPEVQNAFGCSAALSRALGLEHELAAARDRVEERRRRVEDLDAQGAGAPEEPAPAGLARPELPQQELVRRLAQCREQLDQVLEQLHLSQGRQRAMGDPAELSARQETLETALSRRMLEYDALALAMDTMAQANAQLQERTAPQLSALASRYMARLTGQRYTSLTLSRELEGAVRSPGDVLPRSALYLSRGTTDQLYLAVRLAVCALCLPQKPPLILDDALAAFDDSRLNRALELLLELGREQQILLFSCHSRERERLAGVPGAVHLAL